MESSSTTNSSEKEGNNNNVNASADKGTRRNILGKLDAASLTSLKVDFDKALPKWTWKNK